MILSTRESKDLRNTLLNMGISQLSAGSRTNINGYDEEVSLLRAGFRCFL